MYSIVFSSDIIVEFFVLSLHFSKTPIARFYKNSGLRKRQTTAWKCSILVYWMDNVMKMADAGLTQTELAKRLECTQQHVSSILKGNSNLTLETIYKMEKALDISILRDVMTFVDGYSNSIPKSRRMYLDVIFL